MSQDKTTDRPIILTLDSTERAILFNALQDAIDAAEQEGRDGEAGEFWELFHRVEKLPHA